MDCCDRQNWLLVSRLPLRRRSLRLPPSSERPTHMLPGAPLDRFRVPGADALAAAVLVDASRVASVDGGPLQMGSNSHPRVFAPRDELRRSCAGA